jgi:hypothetical protein
LGCRNGSTLRIKLDLVGDGAEAQGLGDRREGGLGGGRADHWILARERLSPRRRARPVVDYTPPARLRLTEHILGRHLRPNVGEQLGQADRVHRGT